VLEVDDPAVERDVIDRVVVAFTERRDVELRRAAEGETSVRVWADGDREANTVADALISAG
jgi:hypothetical protein